VGHAGEYTAYINSPTWRQKRTEYFSARPRRCAVCGATKVDLHHMRYRWPLGSETLDDLIPLCREHHERVHKFHALCKQRGAKVTLYSATRLFIERNGRMDLQTSFPSPTLKKKKSKARKPLGTSARHRATRKRKRVRRNEIAPLLHHNTLARRVSEILDADPVFERAALIVSSSRRPKAKKQVSADRKKRLEDKRKHDDQLKKMKASRLSLHRG
jgi:hypothetical protein